MTKVKHIPMLMCNQEAIEDIASIICFFLSFLKKAAKDKEED